MIGNGTYRVQVRTLHGGFKVVVQRLVAQEGPLALLPSKVSGGLRQFCLLWATRIAYDQVSALTGHLCGEAHRVSGDTVCDWVNQKAWDLDQQREQQIRETQAIPQAQMPLPAYCEACSDADLYDADCANGAIPEYVILTDGIPVKAQKPTRERKGEPKKPRPQKLYSTDVWVLPRRDGTEEVICEGVSGHWSAVDAVQTVLRREWSGAGAATLQVIAVTDGARQIRGDLATLFGDRVRIILDWYHLQHRVYKLLSGAAHSSKERQEWETRILELLWHGRVSEAITFLRSLPSVRRVKDWEDLIGYLEKHAAAGEIIDYKRRQEAGKVIGSGRMEKCVDQVVGHRQKEKGMSWSKVGSRALAMVTAAYLTARNHLSKYVNAAVYPQLQPA